LPFDSTNCFSVI